MLISGNTCWTIRVGWSLQKLIGTIITGPLVLTSVGIKGPHLGRQSLKPLKRPKAKHTLEVGLPLLLMDHLVMLSKLDRREFSFEASLWYNMRSKVFSFWIESDWSGFDLGFFLSQGKVQLDACRSKMRSNKGGPPSIILTRWAKNAKSHLEPLYKFDLSSGKNTRWT